MQRQSIPLFGSASRGLAFQNIQVPERDDILLRLHGLCVPDGTGTKNVPREGKVAAGAAVNTLGRDRGVMGRVRLALRRVDRSKRQPLGGTIAHRSLGVACLALVCTMLASCGGELRLAPPAGPSPQAMSEAPADTGATPVSTAVATRFGQVVWATAIDPATSAPIEPVTSYRPDAPRIIVVLKTFALAAGSLVEATWKYNNTSLDAFTTRLVPAGSAAESWISFGIERSPDVPWPVGTYEVTVSLNGTTVQQVSVEVTE
jgi:hypothetical protein